MTLTDKEIEYDGAYFSPSSLSFIPEAWAHDGTYTEESFPSDAVLLGKHEANEFWRQQPPDGKALGSIEGLPAWVDGPEQGALSRIQIEAIRLREYSNPLTGSDRLFSEASRMEAMKETGFEEVRAQAISRFEEIQAQHPWPAE